MAVEITCKACGRQLTLADVKPGQVNRCPYCQMKIDLPAAEPAPAEPDAEDTDAEDTDEHAPEPQWLVYSFEGERYGPIRTEELDQWVQEQRLTGDCQVFQEGWEGWRWAREFYPVLHAAAELSPDLNSRRDAQAGPAVATGPQPALQPDPTGAALYAGDPRAGTRGNPAARSGTMPHRGGTILVLGALGILFSWVVLGIFVAVPAWTMGQNDLREIREGRMDPAGIDTTRAGMVFGIIGLVLSVLFFVWHIVFTLA